MEASGTEGGTENAAYVAPNCQPQSLVNIPPLANPAIRTVFTTGSARL